MAAAAKLTEDYLTCIVCTEVFNNPATLQCDHTFCRLCLLKYMKTQPVAIEAKSIPCPSCRQMTRVTSPEKPVEDWVNQVKLSRIMHGLMEDFGPGVDTTVFSTCRVCKEEGQETPATVWCSDCEAAFCDTCGSYHRKMPNSCNHDVHGLSADVQPKSSRRFMCRVHEDEQVKLFCKDCKKTICHTRCSIHHRTCKTVVTIKESLTEVTSSLVTRKQKLDKQIMHRNRNIKELKSQIQEVIKNTTKVGSEIKTVSDEAVDLIRAKEKKMMNELGEIRDNIIGKLRLEIKTDEMTRQVSQPVQSQFIAQALKSECQRDIYVMYETCNSDAETSADETEFDSKTQIPERVVFNEKSERLRKYINDLYFGEICRVSIGVGRVSSPVLMQTIDTKNEHDKLTPNITDIVVLSTNGIKICVVTDQQNSSVKSIYPRNSQIQQIKLDGDPYGITSVGNGVVFVTSPGSTKMYKLSSFPCLEIISTINTNRGYRGIHSVQDQKLVAYNWILGHNPSVDILDMSGTVLHTITADAFVIPTFLFETSQGNILVSDLSPSLLFTSSTGKVTKTYKPTGGERTLKYPRGITTTYSGDIMLVDRGADKVIQLTPTGDFVRDILTSADGLQNPHGITIDSHGLMYVTCGRYVNVYMFKLAYDTLTQL